MIFLLNFVPALVLTVYFLTRKRLDPFEPVTIALSYLALNTALSGVSLLAGASTDTGSDYLRSIGLSASSYLTAATLEISAFLAFLLGYSVHPRALRFRIGRYLSQPVSLAHGKAVPLVLTFSLAVLGAIGLRDLIISFSIDLTSIESISRKRFVNLGDSEVSGAAGYTRWLAQFSQYAALLFLAYAYSRQPRLTPAQLVFAVLLIIMAVLPPFLTSSRFALISSLLSAMMVVHYLKKPISLKTLGIVGVLAILSIAILGELRQLRGGTQINISAASVVASIGDRENAGFSLTARIIEQMPSDWNYQFGQTYMNWIFAPVPRSIWPDKPLISLGQEVKVFLFDRSVARGGGVPPSSAGEMYINFGLLALFLSPVFTFIGGVISKSVYWQLVRNNSTSFSIFVYAVLFMNVLPNLFWTQFSKSMVDLIKLLVILFVVRLIVRLFSSSRVVARDVRHMSTMRAS